MPCARKFAVCPMSGTRQTILLPCALDSEHGKQGAHGEQHFCRVSIKKTHGKLQTLGKILNPVTHVPYLPCAYGLNPRQTLNTRQTFETHNGNFFCHVLLDTALYFAVGLILHTAKCLPSVTHGKQLTANNGRQRASLPCATSRAHVAVCNIGTTAK